MLISGKGKELYDKVSRMTLSMAVVPPVSALLAGGACWLFGGGESLSCGAVSAAAALLSAAVSLRLRRGLLGNLGGTILEIMAENQQKEQHNDKNMAPASARSLVAELKELLRQAGEEDRAERQEMEEALARAGERARETLKLLDAAREKLAPVAATGGGGGAVV